MVASGWPRGWRQESLGVPGVPGASSRAGGSAQGRGVGKHPGRGGEGLGTGSAWCDGCLGVMFMRPCSRVCPCPFSAPALGRERARGGSGMLNRDEALGWFLPWIWASGASPPKHSPHPANLHSPLRVVPPAAVPVSPLR